ncbi:MAG: SGNH/GDSL hydrolase family protein [Tannerella sp.]|jgi:lysophospholipase L1-like esterase|nr:SGNH/GDSL hydrolase family protein [Tannerella sp.]
MKGYLLIFSFVLFSVFSIAQQVEDKARIKSLLDNKTPALWVFTGNSITQGAKHTHGLRSFPEIFEERLRWELGRANDFVINTAISGHTTSNILSGFEPRVSRFKPDVVVLMIGTNDASDKNKIDVDSFENNLALIINNIRNINAIPVLLTPNPIITEKVPERARLEYYVAKILTVSRKFNVILVDNWLVWNTELQEKYNGAVFKELLNDPLHPNGQGHKEIAIAIFKELSIFDAGSATCSGDYYEGDHFIENNN